MSTHCDEVGSPDDGHTFVISVRSRGSYKVVGEAHHHDADWMNERPITISVRAWNLRAAMMNAARAGMNDWQGWGEQEDNPPAIVQAGWFARPMLRVRPRWTYRALVLVPDGLGHWVWEAK